MTSYRSAISIFLWGWLLLWLLLPVRVIDAQEINLQFVGGLWLMKEIEGGYYNPTSKAVRYPFANRSEGASRLACVVEEDGRQNVVVASFVNGRFELESVREVFEERAESAFSLADETERRIEDLAWDPRGETVVVASALLDGGQTRYQTYLVEIDRNLRLLPLFPDQSLRRTGFTLASRDHFFYRSGEEVFEYRGGEETTLFTGHVYELSYLADGNQLLYYRYEDNNAGIYLFSLGRSFFGVRDRETMVVNLPTTSELSPRYSDARGEVAFLSNSDPQGRTVQTSGGRNDIRRRWRIYVASLDSLRSLATSGGLTKVERFHQRIHTAGQLEVEDKDYEDVGFRNRNVLKWHGDSIYYLAQDSAYRNAVLAYDTVARRERVYRVGDLGEKVDVGGRQGSFNITGRASAVHSFDVFESGGATLLAISAEAEVSHATVKGSRRPWRSETFLFLYRIPR